jgi:hypothetical protein
MVRLTIAIRNSIPASCKQQQIVGKMASNGACGICEGAIIPRESLVRGAAAGCSGCCLLKDGVSHFVEDFDLLDHLEIFEDMSLFVRIIGLENRLILVLEFYTLTGIRFLRFRFIT